MINSVSDKKNKYVSGNGFENFRLLRAGTHIFLIIFFSGKK